MSYQVGIDDSLIEAGPMAMEENRTVDFCSLFTFSCRV